MLEADVLAAYEASWNDFIEAGDPPSPDAEFLADHMAGDALDVTRNLLRQYHAEGVVLRGTFDVDAVVTELERRPALLSRTARSTSLRWSHPTPEGLQKDTTTSATGSWQN